MDMLRLYKHNLWTTEKGGGEGKGVTFFQHAQDAQKPCTCIGSYDVNHLPYLSRSLLQ
jgi:hypothetical protein